MERPKGFEFTAEHQNKKQKYSEELENDIVEWIHAILGERPSKTGPEGFQAWLKNGVILCQLMNKIQPNSCTSINQSSMALKQMENISKFLEAAVNFGVAKLDLFQVVDLYESGNLAHVQTGLMALGREAMFKDVNLPRIKGNPGHDTAA